jgi:predicted metal-dependent peptidase
MGDKRSRARQEIRKGQSVKNYEKRITMAQLKLLFDVPFFAPAVAKLPIEIKDLSDKPEHCRTAYTDGHKIVMHPGFVDTLSDQQLVTLICHEVCHPMLGHLWRMPPGADATDWNIACDHAVNLMLKEFSEQVTKQGLADPFPFPSDGNYCADPQFKGMAEESIWARMPKKQPQQNGKGGKPGKGGMPAFGGFTTQDETGQPHDSHSKNDWAGTLIQCAKAAQMHGNLPAGIERLVGELVSPKVPWVEILRSWLRERYNDDWDWMKPDPCYDGSGLILPSLESERVGRIIFATDTSGSIDDETLRQFQGEKQGCLDDLRPSSLVDIYCDAKIHKVKEYTPGESIETDAPGGGGTSFVPVFEHLETLPESPKCLVYLTDLDGTFPERDPGYPVLWVTWGSNEQAPFGTVIKV